MPPSVNLLILALSGEVGDADSDVGEPFPEPGALVVEDDRCLVSARISSRLTL